MLPHGNGRSYGDVCLNDEGALLAARSLDRFISFDPVAGTLVCEAGVTLSEILDLIVPCGWFLPVTPGTKYVTVGGAIANDVHGKNHHRVGSFGHFVRRFELLRSDETRLMCTPGLNADWFHATIGGLGLTGLVTWAEIALRRINNAWMVGDTVRFFSLEEFFQLSSASESEYEYTVAWIDCADAHGRGLFMRANHAPAQSEHLSPMPRRSLRIPITPPVALVNRLTLPVFNWAYFWKARTDVGHQVVHYDPFFYPLDSVLQWNRLYGPKGFLQYQCVVPARSAESSIHELLTRIGRRKAGSFLAVLKTFGTMPSMGLMSFPRSGATLALDFPLLGPQTFDLLEELDRIVLEAGGAVYPAKDARMSPAMFEKSFSSLDSFSSFIDPAFSSSFWRRVTTDL